MDEGLRPALLLIAPMALRIFWVSMSWGVAPGWHRSAPIARISRGPNGLVIWHKSTPLARISRGPTARRYHSLGHRPRTKGPTSWPSARGPTARHHHSLGQRPRVESPAHGRYESAPMARISRGPKARRYRSLGHRPRTKGPTSWPSARGLKARHHRSLGHRPRAVLIRAVGAQIPMADVEK